MSVCTDSSSGSRDALVSSCTDSVKAAGCLSDSHFRPLPVKDRLSTFGGVGRHLDFPL